MARLCPDDHSVLEQRTIHEIQVDMCPTCGGLWLDKGELHRLRKLTLEEQRDFERKPNFLPARNTNPSCPICGDVMRPFKYANGAAELETCENLHGVWVQEPELEKIVAVQEPDANARLLAQQLEAEGKERVHHILRVGEFLSAMDHHYGWPVYWGIPQPTSQITKS